MFCRMGPRGPPACGGTWLATAAPRAGRTLPGHLSTGWGLDVLSHLYPEPLVVLTSIGAPSGPAAFLEQVPSPHSGEEETGSQAVSLTKRLQGELVKTSGTQGIWSSLWLGER